MATSPMNCFMRRVTRSMAAQSLAGQSDRELLERLLAGPDEAAFEALVRRHGPMVYRVCWRVLRHAEDCEDAFQATFFLLAQKLRKVKQDSLPSWLHGVARRVALDAQKQAARRRRHEEQAPAARRGPPDEITWRELRTVFDTELASLPEKLRLPLIVCYLEGRSQEEAARQLGWSKRTMLRRLEEARAALGRRLTRKGFAWAAAGSAVLLSDCVAPAALAPKLVGSAVKAAAPALVGSLAAGVISTNITDLVEGVVKGMFTGKSKTCMAGLVLVGTLVSGALFLCGDGLTSRASLAAGQAPRPGAPAARDPDKTKSEAAPPVGGLKPVVVREDASVDRVAWSADGKSVVTVGKTFEVEERNYTDKDGNVVTYKVFIVHSTIKLWDAKTGKMKKLLGQEKRTDFRSIALSPDKKRVAISGMWVGKKGEDSNFVRLLDAETGKVKQEVDEVPRWVHALAFSPDGNTLAMGGVSDRAEQGSWIKLWDVRGEKMKGGTRLAPGGKVIADDRGEKPKPPDQWAVVCLAFSPDGRVVAAGEANIGSGRARIQLYDAQTGKPQQTTFDLGELKRSLPLVQVAFSGDGKKLVSVSGPVKVWDVRTGKVLRTLDTQGLTAPIVAVSRRHVAISGTWRGPGRDKGRPRTGRLCGGRSRPSAGRRPPGSVAARLRPAAVHDRGGVGSLRRPRRHAGVPPGQGQRPQVASAGARLLRARRRLLGRLLAPGPPARGRQARAQPFGRGRRPGDRVVGPGARSRLLPLRRAPA
jgi:RNA polymerase sigma factor (sigma-70 family)